MKYIFYLDAPNLNTLFEKVPELLNYTQDIAKLAQINALQHTFGNYITDLWHERNKLLAIKK